jgi:hypothetical protein
MSTQIKIKSLFLIAVLALVTPQYASADANEELDNLVILSSVVVIGVPAAISVSVAIANSVYVADDTYPGMVVLATGYISGALTTLSGLFLVVVHFTDAKIDYALASGLPLTAIGIWTLSVTGMGHTIPEPTAEAEILDRVFVAPSVMMTSRDDVFLGANAVFVW